MAFLKCSIASSDFPSLFKALARSNSFRPLEGTLLSSSVAEIDAALGWPGRAFSFKTMVTNDTEPDSDLAPRISTVSVVISNRSLSASATTWYLPWGNRLNSNLPVLSV